MTAGPSAKFKTVVSVDLPHPRDPTAPEALHAAFRSFHTIKGLAGFLELHDIRDVAHEVETLLDKARNRALAVTPGLIGISIMSARLARPSCMPHFSPNPG